MKVDMEQQNSSQMSSSMGSSDADYSYDYEVEDVSSSSVAQLKETSDENDPEFVVYKCYKLKEVIPLLQEEISKLAQDCNMAEDEAMFFMQKFNFDTYKLAEELKQKGMDLFVNFKLYSKSERSTALVRATRKDFKIGNPFKVLRSRKLSHKVKAIAAAEPPLCTICYCESEEMRALSCGHKFCSACWVQYFVSALNEDQTSSFECMESKCELQCLSSFVTSLLQVDPIASKNYMENLYLECISCHPNFRCCPTKNCEGIIWCESKKSHKVACDYCKMEFCVQCLKEYHAPSTCLTFSLWTKKCGDDSETANYIRANTKDCPKCSSYIEKNGGCNHMKCEKCKFDFCWICLRDWHTHGSESYYSCSRYTEKNIDGSEPEKKKARRELERYLHYFARYDNHAKSLQLEEQLRAKILENIEKKIANYEGTWIDWQYLFDAAGLLTKCRNTLQFTYPLAYYLEKGPRKELFEYQQAQLEKELEELSWKVERADTTNQSDLENQMHVAECKRRTLLQDFLC